MDLSHDDVQRRLQLLDASQFNELRLESDRVKLLRRRPGELRCTRPAGVSA